MILYFYHKNGDVRFYSDKKHTCDKLECVRLSVSNSDMDLINQGGYNLKIKDGKLDIQKSDYRKKIESKEELKEKVSKVKDLSELKEVILNLL